MRLRIGLLLPGMLQRLLLSRLGLCDTATSIVDDGKAGFIVSFILECFQVKDVEPGHNLKYQPSCLSFRSSLTLCLCFLSYEMRLEMIDEGIVRIKWDGYVGSALKYCPVRRKH